MELFGYLFPSGGWVFAICAALCLILGLPIAFTYTLHNKKYSKSFVFALYALPFAVMSVIMMVSNQVGVAVTVAGVFALIRFRSFPCTAKELVNVFMAMIVGVAVSNARKEVFIIAIIFTAIDCVINIVFNFTNIGAAAPTAKTLKITIPESLDYTEVFDDLFEQYTSSCELVRVKTSNMGSMFQLTYDIVLKDVKEERAFINDLRCRNGNLDIICAKTVENDDKL